MKALIVDDDVELLDLLAYALRREGYAVSVAVDGQQALARFEADTPDIVLLDGTLPKLNGFEVCHRIRQESQTPIILLTAHTQEEDVVRGLQLGADDYVVKPFSVKQLTARMAAVLRRATTDPFRRLSSEVRVGNLVLDRESQSAVRDGEVLRLTRLEFSILFMLATNPGRTIPYARLVEFAWNYYDGGSSGLLKAHVSNLRKKLRLDEDPSLAIEAIHGVGYRLTVQPAAGAGDTPGPAEPFASSPDVPTLAPPRGPRDLVVA